MAVSKKKKKSNKQNSIIATATIPQGEFLQLPQRFRGFCAGYGSGKTTVGCMSLCKNAWELPGYKQGYFAPTYPHIRDIFYPTIEEVAGMMGLTVDIKENKFQSLIFCRLIRLLKLGARSLQGCAMKVLRTLLM